MYETNGIIFRWLGHDGFQLKKANIIIYIDPFKLTQTDLEKADVIIATHQHGDHFSKDDIIKLADSQKTTLITIKQAEAQAKAINAKEVKIVKPGDSISLHNFTFEFVPAYNVNKFRDPKKGIPFHPKEDKHIGVIIDFEGTRVYHTGDSDHIPEMKTLKTDIALLPVSGTYVMTADEAVEAVESLKMTSDLKLAIPMHYGAGVVGDESMAQAFKEKADCKVVILKKE
ncbi:MAG: MBL fold metallo-hydrolase [Candidatus Hodarchaeota archaeon]